MQLVTGLNSIWEGEAATTYMTKFKGLEGRYSAHREDGSGTCIRSGRDGKRISRKATRQAPTRRTD